MLLIQTQNHVLVPSLDLAEALEDLNGHICDLLVVFEGEADDLLSAHHVQLIDAALAHLSLLVVQMGHFCFRLVLFLTSRLTSCLLLGIRILAHRKFLHYLLQFGVKVRSEIPIDLSLNALIGPISKEVLLVEHPDLVVDLCNVLKFVRIDTLCSVWPATKCRDVVIQSLVLLIIAFLNAQVHVE